MQYVNLKESQFGILWNYSIAPVLSAQASAYAWPSPGIACSYGRTNFSRKSFSLDFIKETKALFATGSPFDIKSFRTTLLGISRFSIWYASRVGFRTTSILPQPASFIRNSILRPNNI